MTIELPGNVEERLQDLAARQGREIGVLVEEALEGYLEAAAITDLDASAIAEAQMALLDEFGGITEWRGGSASAHPSQGRAGECRN